MKANLEMDLKKEAARIAYAQIENNSTVGLGDGSAVRSLAGYLIGGIKTGQNFKLYTSSNTTQIVLKEAGLTILDISLADSLDLYFDGCDQVDNRLNALKSGSGIHTQEKLLAVMARKFILLADESKFISTFDPKFPLVLEVLPQARVYVMKKMKILFPDSTLSTRVSTNADELLLTRNGNPLIDCKFPQWPEPSDIQSHCKSLTGVVDISLFYQLASDAIIAGNHGICQYQRKNDLVNLISQYPLELP